MNSPFSNKRIKKYNLLNIEEKISENYVISAAFVNHRYRIRNKPRFSPPPPLIYTLLAGKIDNCSPLLFFFLFFVPFSSPISLSLLSPCFRGWGKGGGKGFLFPPPPELQLVGGKIATLLPLLSFPFSPLSLLFLLSLSLFFFWGGGGGGKACWKPPPWIRAWLYTILS